jgi:hypothetical protein
LGIGLGAECTDKPNYAVTCAAASQADQPKPAAARGGAVTQAAGSHAWVQVMDLEVVVAPGSADSGS